MQNTIPNNTTSSEHPELVLERFEINFECPEKVSLMMVGTSDGRSS